MPHRGHVSGGVARPPWPPAAGQGRAGGRTERPVMLGWPIARSADEGPVFSWEEPGRWGSHRRSGDVAESAFAGVAQSWTRARGIWPRVPPVSPTYSHSPPGCRARNRAVANVAGADEIDRASLTASGVVSLCRSLLRSHFPAVRCSIAGFRRCFHRCFHRARRFAMC
jgi:hypothetical protein